MAAGTVIPKGQQSASYQRWELGSFDAPGGTPRGAASEAKQVNVHARNEGYRDGQREGLEAGRREALAEMASRMTQIDGLLVTLAADLARVDRELSKDVVQLGLAVARNLVGASLKVRPELVQDCVEEALRHVAHANGAVYLIVHPDDAALVKGFLEASSRAKSWSIREDDSIARGGCRVETAGGEIDATLESRWHRTTAALGQPIDWVE